MIVLQSEIRLDVLTIEDMAETYVNMYWAMQTPS